MKYEQITGRSLHDAMTRARAVLGNDIILLETVTLNPTDPDYDEDRTTRITVGVEAKEEERKQTNQALLDAYKYHANDNGNAPVADDNLEKLAFEPILKSSLQKEMTTPIAPSNGSVQALPTPAPKPAPQPQSESEWEKLSRKIDTLQQMVSQAVRPELQEPFSTAYEILIGKGVEQKDALQLVGKVQNRFSNNAGVTLKEIRAAVEREIAPFVPRDRITSTLQKSGQRIITFIGAAGVGKTTSLLKITLHPAMVPVDDIAILSLDAYGIGAKEALTSFSRLTGIPVETVNDEDALKAVLELWSSKKVILVDTPGRSPRYPKYLKELQAQLQIIVPTDIFAVFDMRTELDDMFLNAGNLSILEPSGIVATKFDETTHPGKVISLSKGLGLPIVYDSADQEITGNYEPVKLNLFAE